MASLRRSVSSLGALAAFEAAARHGGFTLAARELGVTQAAVSRQIKLLEADLGTALFLRAHRRVTLTPAGAALAATVTDAFARMADTIETLRRPHVRGAVTVGATLAFSHFWLLPRLAEFRAACPDVRLRLVAEDSAADLRRDRLDILVRYGSPPFEDGRSLASRGDTVFPVCSPALLDRLGATAERAELPALPLIATDWTDPHWLGWAAWARRAGLGPALSRAADLSRLRFNHYTDAVQAAVGGEGVALGWAALLSSLLAEGRLVRIGRLAVAVEERYHVLVPLGREPTPMAAAFIDWIAARFAADP